LLLRGRAGWWGVTRVRGHRLIVVALVVGDRRVLGGIVLWTILAVVLWVVLAMMLCVILGVVLLLTITLLRFLSVASDRGPEKAALRLWGILVRVTLLVRRGVDKGHICLRVSPPPVYSESEEDGKDHHNTCDRYTDARGNAQSFPANDVTKSVVVTISLRQCGRR